MADIVREITHDEDGKPVLILRKKEKLTGTFKLIANPIDSFVIRLDDVWMYSEEHHANFEQYMFDCTMFLCDLFGLGLATPRKMAELATVIQEGIDDLVKLPPQQKRIKNIGEVKFEIKSIEGGKVSGGFSHHGPINDLVAVKG